MTMNELLERQKALASQLDRITDTVRRDYSFGTPYTSMDLPKITPTVEVKEGAVTKVLEAIVENQKTQIEAMQAQKTATEQELETMRAQISDAKREARLARVRDTLLLILAAGSLAATIVLGLLN